MQQRSLWDTEGNGLAEAKAGVLQTGTGPVECLSIGITGKKLG